MQIHNIFLIIITTFFLPFFTIEILKSETDFSETTVSPSTAETTATESDETSTESETGLKKYVGQSELLGILVNSPFFTLLENSIGHMFPAVDIAKKISEIKEKIKAKEAQFEAELKKDGLKIPLLGTFKFEKYQESSQKIADATPTYVGKLYNTKGTEGDVKFGPLSIKILRIYLFDQTKMPVIDADVSLFKEEAKLVQEKVDEDGTKFKLIFVKALKIPVGIKKHATIKEFDLTLGQDEKSITTSTKIFGEKQKEESDIKLDLSAPPFPFKITTKNIPISAIAAFFEKTPIKNLIIKDLDLTATIIPFSIKLFGDTDFEDIKIGLKGKDMSAKMKASIDTAGFHFSFDLKNLELPLGLGEIHEAKLHIGSTEQS